MAAPLAIYDIPNSYDTVVSAGWVNMQGLSRGAAGDGSISCAVLGLGEELIADLSPYALSDAFLQMPGLGAQASANSDQVLVEFRGASGQVLVQIVTVNTSEHWRVDVWDGSAMVEGSVRTAALGSSLARLDIRILIANAGVVQVYDDGTLVFDYSGDTLHGADTEVDNVRFRCQGSATYVGGLLVSNADTRRLRIKEGVFSGTGNYSEYSGAESNTDQLPSADQNTPIIYELGERGTFNTPANEADVTDSWTVHQVAMLLHAKATADPGYNIQALARISAADQEPSGMTSATIAGSFQTGHYHKLPFTDDPTIAGLLTQASDIAAAELGMVARA